MNRLIVAIVFYCIITFILSCGQSGKGPAPSVILSSPPYSQLTDSIKRFPDKPALYLKRAALLSHDNLNRVATEDYKKAWELSSDEEVALEYASNLLITNRLAEAIKFLKECSAKFPDNTEFNRRLGEVYLQKGQTDKALEEYNNILNKDSSNFEAWYDKGSVLLKLQDTAKAIAAYERSFRLMPINYSGMALARLYLAKKDPRALQICNFLLERDTSNRETEPMLMKGMYYSDTKQYENAIKAFDACIERDWKLTDAYIEKGIILFETNKFPEAMKVFNMAATVSNTDADAYYWMGRCYEKEGDKPQAIINYERAYSLDRSFSEARDALKRLNG